MRFLLDPKRHLVCVPYSVPGLHAMASELGIKRCWFHGGRHPHYDVPKGMVETVRRRCDPATPRQVLLTIRSAT